MVWYGMVWYGMVWYGMVWYGMVWYGMVWYGMVWRSIYGQPEATYLLRCEEKVVDCDSQIVSIICHSPSMHCDD